MTDLHIPYPAGDCPSIACDRAGRCGPFPGRPGTSTCSCPPCDCPACQARAVGSSDQAVDVVIFAARVPAAVTAAAGGPGVQLPLLGDVA